MPDDDLFQDNGADPFANVSVNVPEDENDDEEPVEKTDDEPTDDTTDANGSTSDTKDLLTQDDEWVDKTLQRAEQLLTEETTDNIDLPDGEFTYLPGLGYVVANCALNYYRGREHGTFGGKRMTWWNEDSITRRYPYLLINPIPMASTLNLNPENFPGGEFEDFRTMFGLPKGEQWVISDSGGFQVMSRGGTVADTQAEHSFKDAKVHPPTLAKWQVGAADAGTTLDIPPYIMSPNDDPRGDSMDLQFSEWREQIFDPSLEQSIDNAIEMQDEWQDLGVTGDTFERFGVIQGQPASSSNELDDWALLREWHQGLEDVGTWEGMSLKPHPFNDFGNVAFFLGYGAEYLRDYDKIHVLQLGSIYMRALLMYYSVLTGQEVTSDSTGYNMGSQYRSYSIPWRFEQENRMRRMVLSERNHEDTSNDGLSNDELTLKRLSEDEPVTGKATRDLDVVDIPRMPCSCEVCLTIDEVAGPELFTKEDGDVVAATLLNLHNLQEAIDIGRTIQPILQGIGKPAPDGLIIQNGSVKAKKNLFWEVMADTLSDSKLINLCQAMKFVRTSYEDGLDVACQNWSTPWFKESSGGMHRGRSAVNWG